MSAQPVAGPGDAEIIKLPVSGELVDNDHDGEPDIFDHHAELEPRHDDVEHVGPLLDAEFVSDAEYRSARWRQDMQTRPVVPEWLGNRAERREVARWAARYAWHSSKFHTSRAPLYVARLVVSAPRGAIRVIVWWGRWVTDHEARPLRAAAVAAGEFAHYMQLAKMRGDRVRVRAIITVAVVAVSAAGVATASVVWPGSVWLLGAAAVGALGATGRREDKPIVTPAVVTQSATRLVPGVVVRAFAAAGLASEKEPITFAQDIQRDGKGWLAVVDLPYGRTYRQAAKRQPEIASGLDVHQVTVFLDPDPVSERRVRLWVSDIDVFAQKPVVSPLVKAAKFDFWQPIPFGVDARDRLVTVPLVWSSLLVGAIPRMGKTFSARLVVAAGALDPYVRLYVFNGKGDRSWLPFAKVAHRYGSGIRDEVVELLVSSLRELVADMNDRFERMSKLPADVCPEDKLTPALSRNRRMNMPLTVLSIDEIQRYLEHPEHGETILALLVDLAKVAPAAGIMMVLATQKPDSKVLPDELRGQLGTRFAMKVMTWQASETILGAGTKSAGMDASTLLRKHKGVGILLGADDGELAERGGQIVRSHLLDGPSLEQICDRGRALRLADDLLTGMAAGDQPVTSTQPRRILADVAKAFAPGEDKVWSEELVSRLAELDPATYDGWTPAQLATALKPRGVEPQQVWGKTADGQGANRRGYVRDDITDALAAELDKGR